MCVSKIAGDADQQNKMPAVSRAVSGRRPACKPRGYVPCLGENNSLTFVKRGQDSSKPLVMAQWLFSTNFQIPPWWLFWICFERERQRPTIWQGQMVMSLKHAFQLPAYLVFCRCDLFPKVVYLRDAAPALTL